MKLALCRFIYGVIKTFLCNKRVVHVHYVAIDDLVITIPLKKRYNRPIWLCSGRAGASLLGQDVVASLLSLCMAKWLRKWRRGWLYVRSNTKNAKSLISWVGTSYQQHIPTSQFLPGLPYNKTSISVSEKQRSCYNIWIFKHHMGTLYRKQHPQTGRGRMVLWLICIWWLYIYISLLSELAVLLPIMCQ